MDYKIKQNINKNIFRGYDVRGIYPTELDCDTAYTFGLGFGTHIQKIGYNKCIVGHDNRLSSPALYEALIKGITETGVDIISLGLCTTPMYYYACIYLKTPSGVMVTASHNPKDDNGMKFAFDESGNCKGKEIQDFLEEILEGNFLKGEGKVTTYNIQDDEKFPIELDIINEESDGSFPNHHPDPCVESNLEQLKKRVIETHADVGISFDGDGDRLGVVTQKGKFIPTDIYMILIIRDLVNKVEKKEFLYDVKCSKALSDEIEKLGAKAICYRTGNSYTKAKVREENLPFGGELSGHVYFRDKWPGFDSGMYAGARLLEILSNTDKNIEELLEGINHYYSTEEIKFKATDDTKFQIVDKVIDYIKEKGYKYNDIDGARVEFEDGWALIRCSNTGPNITVRF